MTLLNPYVAGSILVLFLSLAGFGAFEFEANKAAKADLKTSQLQTAAAQGLNKQFQQDLSESEADKAQLEAKAAALDAQLVIRDVRVKQLSLKNATIQGEYDALKSKLPTADQDCLNRPLPDSIVERMRDDGTYSDNEDGDGKGKSPSVPAHPLLTQLTPDKNI